MARPIDTAAVEAIRPLGAVADYGPFINAADAIIDSLNANCGSDFSETVLEQIEAFLAAHMAELTDPTILKREEFEDASKAFNTGKLGEGITSTPFGIVANTVSGGCLERTSMAPAVVTFA